VIGGLIQSMPKPVLGGATLVMFGTIATAGVRILASEPLDRRKTLIIATSLGLGLGVMMVPDVLKEAPALIQNMFGSAITTAGVTAIILVLLLPETKQEQVTEVIDE
jgi:xanthine permease XanP